MPKSHKITARIDGISDNAELDRVGRLIKWALQQAQFDVAWVTVENVPATPAQAQAVHEAREAQLLGETDEFKRLSVEATTDMDRRAGTVMGYTPTGVKATEVVHPYDNPMPPMADWEKELLFKTSHYVRDNGVIEVVDQRWYLTRNPAANLATCGICSRTWDDSVSTAVTPVPSGRCPFEYEHPPQERTCGNELCDNPLVVADQFCSPACHREFQLNHGTR